VILDCSDEDEYDELSSMKRANTMYLNLNSSSRNNKIQQRLKLTEKLLGEMAKHKDAWPFLKPVTKREAPNYFEIIRQPIDFASEITSTKSSNRRCLFDIRHLRATAMNASTIKRTAICLSAARGFCASSKKRQAVRSHWRIFMVFFLHLF
jgi:hypothetical protein